MVYDSFEQSLSQIKSWAESLVQAGWLQAQDLAAVASMTSAAPSHLFKSAGHRPLCVAFMGGTGVGKSSLLNRLAGKAIARVGVERPTSKEVTLYHHQSLHLNDLPPQLPLDKIRLAQHDDDRQQQLLWIDMPDFDSTEQKNQHLVLEWLPFIDVLIYVVSPERYRDNKAWQMLLSEGARHAWLFVLNQWDKGCSEQYADFQRQLALAEFTAPLIFKTDCTGVLPDEFNALQTTLTQLATEHTIQQLESRNLQQRQQQLQQSLEHLLQQLGSAAEHAQLPEHWHRIWQQTTPLLRKAFVWPLKTQSERYAAQAGSSAMLQQPRDESPWDDWAQTRLNDALDQLILQADSLHIPTGPLRQSLEPCRQQAQGWIDSALLLEARQALANPGNGVQRALLKFGLFAEIVLPISAMGFVAYQVLQGYYASSLTHTHYLGVDFAIHSSLLIALSWLIPFFMRKKLRPSLQKAALRGLSNGLEQGFNQLDLAVLNALSQIAQQRQHYHNQVKHLIQASQPAATKSLDGLRGNLGRMLTNPHIQRIDDSN